MAIAISNLILFTLPQSPLRLIARSTSFLVPMIVTGIGLPRRVTESQAYFLLPHKSDADFPPCLLTPLQSDTLRPAAMRGITIDIDEELSLGIIEVGLVEELV